MLPADILAGLSADMIADAAGVCARTARRYLAAPDSIPLPVLKLLAIVLRGELGAIDRAWAGWRLVRGELVSERDAMSFTPAAVRAAPFTERALRAAQDRNRFAVQADWVQGKYEEPGRLQAGEPAETQPRARLKY